MPPGLRHTIFLPGSLVAIEQPIAAIVKAPSCHSTPSPEREFFDAADAMIAVAGHFGLTPVARSRLAAGVGGQPPGPSKFEGLIRG